jgi:hypothetical protein
MAETALRRSARLVYSLVPTHHRHGRAARSVCDGSPGPRSPGHPRPWLPLVRKDVDARHKRPGVTGVCDPETVPLHQPKRVPDAAGRAVWEFRERGSRYVRAWTVRRSVIRTVNPGRATSTKRNEASRQQTGAKVCGGHRTDVASPCPRPFKIVPLVQAFLKNNPKGSSIVGSRTGATV